MERLKLGKQLCEHPFRTITRFFGYTGFLVKLRADWTLMTLAQN